MNNQGHSYVLQGGAAELQSLRLHAQVWEPEAEALLDIIGVPPGAACLDLGCGAMGILGPLSSRAGAGGRIIGVDRDDEQLAGARAYVEEKGLTNVEVRKADAYSSGLPSASFDIVHVRFLFAPAGRNEELLAEMLRLTKPGGVVAIQQPDATPWTCFPHSAAWDRLKNAILEAFRLSGGDFNVGQRTYKLLLDGGGPAHKTVVLPQIACCNSTSGVAPAGAADRSWPGHTPCV